jgi:hypothetical protein
VTTLSLPKIGLKMTALHGDKIESLLWENGFEFQHRQYLYLPSEVEVYSDRHTIILGETWLEEDEWMLDSDHTTFELWQDGELVGGGTLDDPETEKDFLNQIVTLTEAAYHGSKV